MIEGLKITAVLAVMLMSMAALSACNTVEGFGEDVEATGENIEDTANSNK